MKIYTLEYYKEIDCRDFDAEEYNLIGLYISEKDAKNAKRKVALEMNIDEKLLFVSSTNIGDVQWEGGFVSTADLDNDFETLTDCFNEWLGSNKSPRESWEDEKFYNALCDINKVIYKIKDIKELAEYIRQIWIVRFGDRSRDVDDYMQIASVIISKGFYELYD